MTALEDAERSLTPTGTPLAGTGNEKMKTLWVKAVQNGSVLSEHVLDVEMVEGKE